MTLQVTSEISKELAACTICTGVVLRDGERIGAIADVDLFAAFVVDMGDASKKYNRANPHKAPIEGKGDLWEVRKLAKPAINKRVSKQVQQPIGVAELMRRAELGLDLWEATQLSEAERNFQGIKDEEFENSTDDE